MRWRISGVGKPVQDSETVHANNNPRRGQLATKTGGRHRYTWRGRQYRYFSPNQSPDRKKLVGTRTHNDHDDPPKHHLFSRSFPLRTNRPKGASQDLLPSVTKPAVFSKQTDDASFHSGADQKGDFPLSSCRNRSGKHRDVELFEWSVCFETNIVDHSSFSVAIGPRTIPSPHPGSVSRGSSCGIAQKSRRGLTCASVSLAR